MATHDQFSNLWMHNGFVNVDDEKMSKSLGKFFTLREVLPQLRDPSDKAICASVAEMESGLYDADPGGGFFKKRIARPGKGKSAGFRTLAATKFADVMTKQ